LQVVSYADPRQHGFGSEGRIYATESGPKALASLHIVHILTRFLRAGSEENTVATCLWQAAAGHRVTLLHGEDADPCWAALLRDRVDIQPVPEMVHAIRPQQDVRAFRAIARRLRQLSPDVLHTHQSKAGILGRLAAPRGTLVVHGIHIMPFEGVGRLARIGYLAAERLAAGRTDQFIAVSPFVGQAYVRHGISRADATSVIYSGMELDRFRRASPPPDTKDLIGADPADPNRPGVVLMLAAFEPRKRHAAFLRSLARCRHLLASFRLLLAGTGPEERTVRQLVQDLDLSDVVTFCGHRPDPEALIACADLTVLTSEREGLPRVVIQSLAGGRPIVVARLAGIEDIVRDGVNGYITDPTDMDDMIRRIADLLGDRGRLAALTSGASSTDVSRWSAEQLGAETTALYQKALAARATG
jgi:glycosyltransferase involved in cell wall biosynthesis